jgi:catechol 2,3-dioxygenase-like lactoylglutathione lyase family enzyme
MSTLVVRDLRESLEFFRDVLGFDLCDAPGLPVGMGRVGLHECEILLLQSDRPAPRVSRRMLRSGSWDVVLFVPNPLTLLARMIGHGAHIMVGPARGPLSSTMFEVRDPDGNVLCFADRDDDLRQQPGGQVPAGQGDLDWEAQRVSRTEEHAHLREFAAFYQRVVRGLDAPLFMFFTSGLLHWVSATLRRVPDDVPVVLVGSDLTSAELRWLHRCGRPVHHVRIAIDDATMWDYLLETAERDFGWLDIDCLIMDRAILDDVRRLPSGAALNCVWTWDSGHGIDLACTHLLFVSVAAVAEVRQLAGRASANQYDYHGSARRFALRRCFMNCPTKREHELLARLLPLDDEGRAVYPGDYDYFDTLVVFQLMARIVGRSVNAIRPLRRRLVIPTSLTDDLPGNWPEDASDEVFHVFGVSYFNHYFHHPTIRMLYLALEALALDQMPEPPEFYVRRAAAVSQELADDRINLDAAALIVRRHLVRSRRVSPSAAVKAVQWGPSA